MDAGFGAGGFDVAEGAVRAGAEGELGRVDVPLAVVAAVWGAAVAASAACFGFAGSGSFVVGGTIGGTAGVTSADVTVGIDGLAVLRGVFCGERETPM